MRCRNIALILIIGSLGNCVSIENYCSLWEHDSSDTCIENIRNSQHFKDNSEFVIKSKMTGDFSVGNSYYMKMNKDEFKRNMLLEKSHSLLLPPVNMNSMKKYGCNVFPVTENVHRSFSRLEEPLDVGLIVYKSYILSGILDTMYTMFKASLPHFDVDLSLNMFQDFVGENATVTEALHFLQTKGVCSSVDYAKEITRGTGKYPLCYRFKLRSFERLNFTNTCQLAFAVRKAPVFALAAVNPQAFQLYAIKSSSHPVNKSYSRYTIAGVVTGYNRYDDHPYWEMIVRRQGVRNSVVRVKMDMKYPFAGIVNMSYLLDADTEDYRVNNPNRSVKEVCSVTELNDVPVDVTTIRVLSGCMNAESMSLQITDLSELRVLEIGNSSMQRVSSLQLSNLPYLRYVFIGDNCFSVFKAKGDLESSSLRRTLTVESNPRLEAIILGVYTFSEYDSLILKSLPALLNLQIGIHSTDYHVRSYNFFYLKSLAIEDLPSLRTISLGNFAFANAKTIRLSKLPKLTSTTVGYSVAGGVNDNCVANSLLTLHELDSLTSLAIFTRAFNHIKTVRIQGVPSLSSAYFDQGSMGCVKTLEVEGRVKSNHEIVSAFCKFRDSLSVYLNHAIVSTCKILVM